MSRAIALLTSALVLLASGLGTTAAAQDPPDDGRTALQVSGGVTPSQAPEYMAYILNVNGGSSSLCTGTLISREWVATAAHCVDTGATTTVILGRLNVDNPDEGITRGVVEKVVDADWAAADAGGGNCQGGFCNYDVGVLRLDSAVPDDWEVAPLPPTAYDPTPGVDQPLYRGYGLVNANPPIFADQLQETQLGDFELQEPCLSASNVSEFWCFEKLADARTEGGDSGGPWMLYEGNWMLFAVHSGIVIEGFPPNATTWSLGTNVADVPWLRSTTGIPTYGANTVLRDSTTGDAWYVDSSGFRRTVASADEVQCLVDLGAALIDATPSIYTTVPLGSSPKTCDPDLALVQFAVSGSFEDIGNLTDAGSIVLLNAFNDGTATGSTSLHQDSHGVPGVSEAGDRYGHATVWADVNGDGDRDLVVGAPHERVGSIESGAITVMLFDAAGPTGTGKAIHQGTDGVPGGNENGDRWGWSLAAGDFDGDGYDDVAVGAPGEGLGNADGAGAVTILWGSPAGLTGSGSVAFHQDTAGVPGGNESGDGFGSSLAVAGTQSGSSLFLAVGAPNEDIGSSVDAGSVTLFATSANGLEPVPDLLYQGASARGRRPDLPGSSEAGDQWGHALAGLPNGLLAIGAQGEDIGSIADAGAVTLYDGFAGTPRASALHQGSTGIPGSNETGDLWGSAVAGAVVDGNAMLVVGAHGEAIGSTRAGAVTVIPNAAPDTSVTGATPLHQGSPGVPGSNEDGDAFGHGIVVDDSGAILVTSPYESIGSASDTGAVTVFFGTPTDPDADGAHAFHQDKAHVPGSNEDDDAWGA